MVSQMPPQSTHLVKLSPPDQDAVAVVSNLQRSRASDRHQPFASILLASDLGNHFRRYLALLTSKVVSFLKPDSFDAYKEISLNDQAIKRLQRVGRKTLVLDLDETLVHSCYTDPETNENVGLPVPDTALPDFLVHVPISGVDPIELQVYKRPYVDVFLYYVSKWYEVVIYTASMEVYAAQVVDRLDIGRVMIPRRFYRQHCTSFESLFTKDLTLANPDMSATFIIDNSPMVYRDFPKNAIPIKSYIYDPSDTELLKLLPFLDALRFTKDVRTVLSRRVS
ncbi:hypothetical protein KR009_010468 [Drosophila setifemur]|nr:hypothetical protein KR009_010468 [Drosophila setifemur]